MKVLRSLKSWKTRNEKNKIVKRGKRLYVINAKDPRQKARQGSK
ncbi:MAG: 50S ribosomal protein L36 [Rickettsiales bacterium]|jgi:ribosomal protein L36|nr:50S ribosomal protein L36 [Rickettsiales bacterium]